MIDRINAVPYEPVSITSFDGLKLNGRYYHVRDGAPVNICFHGYRGTPSRDFSGGAMLVLERGTGMLINIAIYLVSGIVHFDWGKWLSLPEPVESEQQN